MVCYMVSFGKALPRTMHELFEGLVNHTITTWIAAAVSKFHEPDTAGLGGVEI